MPRRNPKTGLYIALLFGLAPLLTGGCSHLNYWKSNDFKVGPNYCPPTAPVAAGFSHQESPLIRNDQVLDPRWWMLFNDPALNDLIDSVYEQNLTLKQASWRIEESRALLAVQTTTLLPQQSLATGSYSRNQNNALGSPVSSDRWAFGFNSGGELDFWGKCRRGIDGAEAQLDASVKDYDFALISLISDVANLYIQIRSLEERIDLAERNIAAFEGSLKVTKARVEEEVASPADVAQAESNLYLVKATIPQFEFARQQSLKALAVLLAVPHKRKSRLRCRRVSRPRVYLILQRWHRPIIQLERFELRANPSTSTSERSKIQSA